MALVEGKGVTRHFGGLTATQNVDFHIDEGEIVGLIGPNGAGKTTLFNLISGSLAPTAGTIRFKGKIISGLKPFQICRMGIARTFQLVQLFENMTVLENVLAASFFGLSERRSEQVVQRKAIESLDFVGLSNLASITAKELTIADQKRLEIARALATRPELLLIDEVMAGLNPSEANGAITLIKNIRDSGITIFMIEHVMKAIMGISDRIMVLHHGRTISEGSPEEVSQDKKVIEVYLGR
jgi:branched-chain amino acid transport system ATP-binding protein